MLFVGLVGFHVPDLVADVVRLGGDMCPFARAWLVVVSSALDMSAGDVVLWLCMGECMSCVHEAEVLSSAGLEWKLWL